MDGNILIKQAEKEVNESGETECETDYDTGADSEYEEIGDMSYI